MRSSLREMWSVSPFPRELSRRTILHKRCRNSLIFVGLPFTILPSEFYTLFKSSPNHENLADFKINSADPTETAAFQIIHDHNSFWPRLMCPFWILMHKLVMNFHIIWEIQQTAKQPLVLLKTDNHQFDKSKPSLYS